MTNAKIVELFLVEAHELISTLEDELVVIEERPHDIELINSIFRAIHTIKGSAGLSNLPVISEFSHMMENVFERIRVQELAVDAGFVNASLSCVDVLKEMIEQVSLGQSGANVDGIEKATELMSHYLKGASQLPNPLGRATPDVLELDSGVGEKRVYEIVFQLNDTIFESGQDPVMLIYELADFGTIEKLNVDISGLPDFLDFDPEKLYLKWRLVFSTAAPSSRIHDVFLFVAEDSDLDIRDVGDQFQNGVFLEDADKKIGEILIEEGHVKRSELEAALARQKPVGALLVEDGIVSAEQLEEGLQRQLTAKKTKYRDAIRVDVDKLDKLVNLVGELVTGVSQVSQLSNVFSMQAIPSQEQVEQLLESSETLEQLTRDIQDQIMNVRMVPIEGMFNRYKRVVRDMADTLHKKIRLSMSGTETELDKNVIDVLADPLKHIVRNCVDHGIEAPAERLAAGKSEFGQIHLGAKQREGSIIIEIEDDGRGLDKDRILQKAIERGLANPSAQYSDNDIFRFVFEPGFSTAQAVTDVSGRGVGMDVVRKNIEQLNGSVDMESQPGRGARVTMKIPLTLAIIEGMTVQVGDEVLTLPLLSIVEQIKPEKRHLKTVEGSGELLNFRGEYVPLVRLQDVFGFEAASASPSDALVMVLESESRRYGLLVDNVLGQQQAVIKSLDKNFQKVEGITGATILGDGRVSLILDPYEIEQMALGKHQNHAGPRN